MHHDLIEAGCDEAGRGCLSGPVFAAAVVLPQNFRNEMLNDSKKLNHKQRSILRQIIENEALAFAVANVSNQRIDEINILNASIECMHKALQKLTIQPEHILIDGNRFKKYGNIPYTCIVKGDGIYMPIAAASVLAKTYRDDFMEKLHTDFPQYNWKQNKGYPTIKHRRAIEQFGPTTWHRMSFKLTDTQLKIVF